jgi:hypothetical protein
VAANEEERPINSHIGIKSEQSTQDELRMLREQLNEEIRLRKAAEERLNQHLVAHEVAGTSPSNIVQRN